jgi:hypothetical protein
MFGVQPSHRRILLRLDGILREIRTDPPFRRSLRGDPRAALAIRGFDVSDVPKSLPAIRGADPLLTHGQLFGLVRGSRPPELPLELRLLVYGLRPLVLIHGRESELSAWIAWAEARGYTALLSADEWDRHADEGKGGYSNLAVNRRSARAGSGAWRSLLVGVDEDRVILGWLARTLGLDELLGRLLGYPRCCAAAFVKRWGEAVASHQGDVIPACIAASGVGPHDWRANTIGRYFGIEFIQHFPCHFGCDQTVSAAARTEAALSAWEPWFVEQAQTLLAAPALYTERSGVAILPGADVRCCEAGNEMTYDACRALVTEPDGLLDRALRANSSIRELPGGRGFAVGEQPFDGALLWFDRMSAIGKRGTPHAVS